MDNFLDKTNGPMMNFFDAVYKLLILNLLFVLFTLVGLIIFGLFPSWLTLHQLVKREFHDHEKGIQYFSEYKKLFIENIVPGNLLLVFTLVIGGITLLDVIYILDQYIGVDELTFGGIVFTIGGFLLSYIVFGVIAIFGIIWAYYDRFSVKDTLKFSFFTVLSSPIFVLLSLLTVGASYLVFSILVSAAPFLAFSAPIALITLLYAKPYKKIFLIKKDAQFSFFNLRYIQDISRYIDVVNSVLPNETMYINSDVFISLIKQDNIDLQSSVAVLDELKNVVGVMIVSNDDTKAFIECLVVKKGFEKHGIATNMLQVLTSQTNYQEIHAKTNKKTYHESFKQLYSLELFLKKKGFMKIEEDTYKLDL